MARYYISVKSNGYCGAPLTLSLIRQDNVAIYLGFRESSELKLDDETAFLVAPVMNAAPIALRWRYTQEIREDLAKYFAGDSDITIVSNTLDDIVYMCRMLSVSVGKMITIGVKPPSLTFDVQSVEIYPTVVQNAVRHNAFWDAMALKAKMEPPAEGTGPAIHMGGIKADFHTTANTLAWEYVGDLSQDIDSCSYNEDSIRHYWLTDTLDEAVKEKIAEYPHRFENWPWFREDGRYGDNMTALVIRHGGWPEDWGPYAAPLTDAEKLKVAKFVSEHNLYWPADEEFGIARGAEHLTLANLLATYILNLPAELGTYENIRAMWNGGVLGKALNDYQRINADWNFDYNDEITFQRYDGRYGDLMTYYVKKEGGWWDGKKLVPLTTNENEVCNAFHYKVIIEG